MLIDFSQEKSLINAASVEILKLQQLGVQSTAFVKSATQQIKSISLNVLLWDATGKTSIITEAEKINYNFNILFKQS